MVFRMAVRAKADQVLAAILMFPWPNLMSGIGGCLLDNVVRLELLRRATDFAYLHNHLRIVGTCVSLSILAEILFANLHRSCQKLAIHIQPTTDLEAIHRGSAARTQLAIVDKHSFLYIRIHRQMIQRDCGMPSNLRQLSQFVQMGREEKMRRTSRECLDP